MSSFLICITRNKKTKQTTIKCVISVQIEWEKWITIIKKKNFGKRLRILIPKYWCHSVLMNLKHKLEFPLPCPIASHINSAEIRK